MNCQEVLDNLELYISGELEPEVADPLSRHLKSCPHCHREYIRSQELINSLHQLPQQIRLKDVLKVQMQNEINKNATSKKFKHRSGFAIGAAAVFFVLFTLSSTLLAFPALAEKYTPSLPIVQNLSHLKTETAALKDQTVALQSEADALKVQMKQIDGTSLKVVETRAALDSADNAQVQTLALSFIKAQYKGDMQKIQSITTPEFYQKIQTRQSQYIWTDNGAVIFGSITNVAKEKDSYLVYVRISDSRDDSEFQENFILVNDNGTYKIKEVELDK
ncbi:hypothetical protein JCM15765_07790 [Paradesulfitobacterium aromaticivorans]